MEKDWFLLFFVNLSEVNIIEDLFILRSTFESDMLFRKIYGSADKNILGSLKAG